MNSEDWRDSMDRKWPYSRASAQVRLVIDACAATGVSIGVRLNGDQVDFVYEEGALLVRDAYVDRVRAVVGGGDVTDGLTGGVTHYSLAGARMGTEGRDCTETTGWTCCAPAHRKSARRRGAVESPEVSCRRRRAG